MNGDAIKSNVTRAAGIVLGWAAGRYHLDPTQVGAMMSDVGYLGSAAAMAYGAYQHWNMKKVPVASTAIETTGPAAVAAVGSPVANVSGKVVG